MGKQQQVQIKKSDQAKSSKSVELDLRTPSGKKLPY